MSKENEASGKYSQGFFLLKLCKTEKDFFEILNDIGRLLTIYIHEYVHFLQDISTNYLLYDTSIRLRRFNLSIRTLKEDPNSEVDLPYFKKVPFTNEEEQINKQEDFVYGQKIPNFEIGNLKIQNIKLNELLQQNDEKLEYFSLELSDGESFNFGSFYIIESMARYAQKILNENITYKNYFHYSLIDLILEFYNINIPLYLRMCLCEASLMWYNPSEFLIKFLMTLKAKNQTSFTKEYLQAFFETSTSINIDHELKENHEKIFKYYESIYTIKNGTQTILDYIGHILSKSQEKRGNNLFFISNIFSQDKHKILEFLKDLMIDIGSPIIFNEDFNLKILGKEFINANQNELLLLFGFYELYRKLTYEDVYVPCTLTKLCKHLQTSCQDKKYNFIDANCLENPLAKINDEYPCIFAKAMLFWGLHNKSF